MLVRQVQTGVRWRETILAMEADGIDLAVEIGPGPDAERAGKKDRSVDSNHDLIHCC